MTTFHENSFELGYDAGYQDGFSIGKGMAEYNYKEVTSQSDPKKIYIVLLVNGAPRMCSCPDFCFRIVPSGGAHQCKHMKGLCDDADRD